MQEPSPASVLAKMDNSFLRLPALAAIRRVLTQTQELERQWDDPGHAARMTALAKTLDMCRHHPDNEVKEIAGLLRHLNSDCSHKHFLGVLVPLERQFAKGVYDHDFIPHEGDRPPQEKQQTWPILVILDNIRSAFNVGAIFRSAECFGCEGLILCGYTATPDNPKLLKTTMGTEQNVAWQYEAHTAKAIRNIKDQGYHTIALERSPSSISLYQYRFPKKTALILGNERHGLAPHIIKDCEATTHIPMWGSKNSLNVGAAFACVASEVRRQSVD